MLEKIKLYEAKKTSGNEAYEKGVFEVIQLYYISSINICSIRKQLKSIMKHLKLILNIH